ncbi:phosphatase PAP2 family protein [Microbacterium lacticum]
MRAAPRAWHFLATAAALVVLLAASYLFFVHGYMGQLIDEQARSGAELGRAGDAAARLLDAVPLLSAGMVVLAVLIGLLRRKSLATVVALGVVAAANLTSQLLKHQLLSRPDNGATGTWHNSFPSGHTTVFVSGVFALFLVCAPRVRPYVATLGALASVVVGALLVASGWHRPSDVVGGVLVVAIYVFLGGALLARLRPVSARGSAPGAGGTIGLLIAAAAVSAAAFGLAYVTTDASVEGAPAAALAGFVAIAAVTASTGALAARLFRRIA